MKVTAGGRAPAVALGLSEAQIHERIVQPWQAGSPLVLDGQAFGPGTYRVEILKCPFVFTEIPPARSFARLPYETVTDQFLNAVPRSPEPSPAPDRRKSGNPGMDADAREQDSPSGEQAGATKTETTALADPQPGWEPWRSAEVAIFFTVAALALSVVPLLALPRLWALVVSLAMTFGLLAGLRWIAPYIHRFTRAVVGPAQSARRRRRLSWALGAATLVAIVGLGVLLTNRGAGNHIPPHGAVVDAQNGTVSSRDSLTRPKPGGPVGIEGGEIFRTCNLTADQPCAYPLNAPPTDVRPGDIVELRIRLHESSGHLLSYVKLEVNLGGFAEKRLEVYLSIEWPTAGGTRSFESPPTIDPARLRLTVSGRHRLVLIPGTTKLLDPDDHRIAWLPDDIDRAGGLILKNVGSPPGCWNCDLDKIRFVQVQARIE